MADGVAITAGSGTTIATDDCGSPGHVQLVKQAYSANGDATLVGADANGLDVDLTRVPVASTATLANIGASVTNVTLDASNSSRLGLFVYNDSSAVLYLKYGATASATSFTVKMQPEAYWEMPQPIYTGTVDGIWTAAVGNARVTELTA